MVIAGAKGFAKELLEILAVKGALDNLYFFDNVSADAPARLFDRFPLLRTFEEVESAFQQTSDPTFALGLGGPVLRRTLCDEFLRIGGTLTSVVSPHAHIGAFDVVIAAGCCILPGAVVTSSVKMGRGCLLNPNVTVSHDATIGEFVEMAPGASVTGHCSIGDFTFLGTHCSVLPKVRVGRNVIVGAGAVVTKDVPDNTMVAGVPAVIKKKVDPIRY